MPTLSRDELLEACRTIYNSAGGAFMLPPLIRDAQDLGAKLAHTHYSLTEEGCVRFVAEFDQDYVDSNKPPYARLPLRFRCELCDLDFRNSPVVLAGYERLALIRAFLLGAKAPIFAEKKAGESSYKLSVQLSSTFFVECGELIDDGGDPAPEAIVGAVALNLYERSAEFFENRDEGLLVWGLRARQELFGEPTPEPEVLWRRVDFWGGASKDLVVAECGLEPPIVILPPARPGAALALARISSAVVDPRRRLLQSAAAMLAVAGAIGSFVLRSDIPAQAPVLADAPVKAASPPAGAADPARLAVAAHEPVATIAPRLAPAAASPSPAFTVARLDPRAERDDPEDALIAPRTGDYSAVPGLGARDLPKGACEALKPEPRPGAGRARNVTRVSRRQSSNPIVFVERTLAGVVRDLKRLPQRVSSLFSGPSRRRR